jgi:hypothetical protein
MITKEILAEIATQLEKSTLKLTEKEIVFAIHFKSELERSVKEGYAIYEQPPLTPERKEIARKWIGHILNIKSF